MAGLYKRPESGVMRIAAILLLSLLLATRGSPAAAQALYNQPVLVVDPDTHTGRIKSVAISDTGNVAVTGSYDKTVRIWSLATGEPINTIRMPAGPGYIGRVYAVATTTKGDLVAVGGCTSGKDDPESVYLFDPQTLAIVKRIDNLTDVVSKLAFSPDGRYLAVGAGTTGLRVYDREMQWSQVFSDPNYGQRFIYGLSFATDGRLATAGSDKKVRLYGPGPEFKLLVPPKDALAEPYEIAFRPDGDVLAVGYSSPRVDLLDAHDLHGLSQPDTIGLDSKLAVVAWSRDGSKLFVGGGSRVFVWDDAGRGQRHDLATGNDTVMSLATSADGGILVGAAGPLLKYMDSDGKLRWKQTAPIARIGSEGGRLSVSPDGSIVDFGYENGHALIRFNMKNLTLKLEPEADGVTVPPKRDGLPVDQDANGSLLFRREKVKLETAEEVRSLAISPDSKLFVFGTTWTIRVRDDSNRPIWHREMGDVWAVNITGDNRYAVAAYDDGTIRWHQLATGEEVVALMMLPKDDKNDYDWVAWTPEGYYFATPGAFRVLQWHTNDLQDERAFGHAVPASSVPNHRRRDVLEKVIDTMDAKSAFTLAQRAEANKAVQAAAPAKRPPGKRLHVVAIGINYTQWESLTLQYAEADASDLLGRLIKTQTRTGLYADVLPHPLDSNSAKQLAITQVLDEIESEMHPDDVAIVFFSGHGVMIGNKFYLVPSDVENLTKAGIQTRGVSDELFRERIAKLASHGRVLVLMDACHSGAFPDSETLLPDAERIRDQISWLNTTVLTSSSATELSHEDPAWNHGAFTKLLLDALSASSSADADYNGTITVDELIKYLDKYLPVLTKEKGAQTLGVSRHAPDGDLFVAGF
jgi:WD40 repeat protein